MSEATEISSFDEILDYFEYCCRHNEFAEIIEIINEEPSVIHHLKGFMYACGNGNLKVLEVLLPKMNKTQINAQNDEGNTGMHWAALNGHEDTVKLLLQFHAIPTIRNKAGFSPATLAEQREFHSTANAIYQSYDPEDLQENEQVEE